MTLHQRREFIFKDEWRAIWTAIFCWLFAPPLFAWLVAGLVVFVYLASYVPFLVMEWRDLHPRPPPPEPSHVVAEMDALLSAFQVSR